MASERPFYRDESVGQPRGIESLQLTAHSLRLAGAASHTSEKAGKHALNLLIDRIELARGLGRGVAKSSRQMYLVAHLLARPDGDVDELRELLRALADNTFGEVHRNRIRGAPHLGSQGEQLTVRKRGSQLVDLQHQSISPLEHLILPDISHSPPPRFRF